MTEKDVRRVCREISLALSQWKMAVIQGRFRIIIFIVLILCIFIITTMVIIIA